MGDNSDWARPNLASALQLLCWCDEYYVGREREREYNMRVVSNNFSAHGTNFSLNF